MGCQTPIEPTYKEADIPDTVKKICKDEYGLEVIARRLPNALWIYAPLSKIFHKEYGIKKDKIFDEETTDKLREILTTVGRVLISADKAPEFFALLASDINLGLDYTIIGSVTDIKKSYAGAIPFTELNKRYVIELKLAPDAIGDTEGEHLKAYDIKLPDFLAEQIAQRIAMQFQEENLRKRFRIEKSQGRFDNGTFIFEYAIEEISPPDKNTYIMKEALNTITYCLKTYEFQDFSRLEIKDLIRQDKLVLSKAEVWARPTD